MFFLFRRFNEFSQKIGSKFFFLMFFFTALPHQIENFIWCKTEKLNKIALSADIVSSTRSSVLWFSEPHLRGVAELHVASGMPQLRMFVTSCYI